MLAGSFGKWLKLTRLRRKIVRRGETTEDVLADFRETLARGGSKRAAALEAYFDACASDAEVVSIMQRYGLARDDLRNIYVRLSLSLGDRAALSTIAYAEPLLFYVEATRREMGHKLMVWELKSYWVGAIPRGSLCSKLPAAPVLSSITPAMLFALLVCLLGPPIAQAVSADELDDIHLIFAERCTFRDYPTFHAQVQCTDKNSPSGPALEVFDRLAAQVESHMRAHGVSDYDARVNLNQLLSRAQRNLERGWPADADGGDDGRRQEPASPPPVPPPPPNASSRPYEPPEPPPTFGQKLSRALQGAAIAMQEAPLAPYKQKCLAFGFTQGTPDFARCVQQQYNAAQPARPISCTADPVFLTCEQ